MKEYTMFDVSALILRAFSLAKKSAGMAFVGIYSAETYKPLALADREHVQITATKETEELQTKPMAVEINRSQIQAIVKHIRIPDTPLTQINIARLRFLCLSHGTGCMTGQSSFNMDTKRVSIADINKSVFRIIHKHYTSQELLEEEHALQISAIIKGELIIVGMCKEGEESSLEILKAVFEKPNNTEVDNIETGLEENRSYAHEPLIVPEVELRRSAKPTEEKRRLPQKEKPPVCENSSTGALGMSVSFGMEGNLSDRDDRPLIKNIESIDMRIGENVCIGSEK